MRVNTHEPARCRPDRPVPQVCVLTRYLILAAAVVMPEPFAAAKDVDYVGTVEVVRGTLPAKAARGTVFLDANRNARLDEGESGVADVAVSNGREVVSTRPDGSYELPAYRDMNLFITKPAGYTTPVSEEMVPQFHYIHKIEGSPLCALEASKRPGRYPKPSTFHLSRILSATPFPVSYSAMHRPTRIRNWVMCATLPARCWSRATIPRRNALSLQET